MKWYMYFNNFVFRKLYFKDINSFIEEIFSDFEKSKTDRSMSDLVVISCESLLDIRNSYNETDLKDMTDEWKVFEKSRNNLWPILTLKISSKLLKSMEGQKFKNKTLEIWDIPEDLIDWTNCSKLPFSRKDQKSPF